MPKKINLDLAFHIIDDLWDEHQLGHGTYQCAADIIQLLDVDNDPDGEFLEEIVAMSEEQLAEWRRQEVVEWKYDLTLEKWAERFEVGEDKAFKSIDQLMQCTDWKFILTELLPSVVTIES